MQKTDMQTGAGAVRLGTSTLSTLQADVTVPGYDRRALTPSVVHLGVGGFHRAHQAVYLDDLAEGGITTEWGLCGVGLLPGDKRMEEALVPQDGLYTVVERSAGGNAARVIGSMTSYLFAPDAPGRVLDVLTDPATRIVTMTITEGGYNVNGTTGRFEEDRPEIRADLASPSAPATVFGYLVEALDRRRREGIRPFTVLSCDNVQSNGEVAKNAILSFARLRDRALAAWIEENVTFPNCMVDRITPQTTDLDREMVAQEFGVRDAWPVVTEPFKQWIVEDHFCNGRPPLERVGVQFVEDVHPYEMMKLRLLNASHSSLAYLGYLAGYQYVHEVMADPQFVDFILRIMNVEVTPLLPPVPGIDLEEYKRTLIERFANPTIGDQVQRLCLDGSSKLPKFILPSIVEAIESGRPHRYLTLAVAGWLRYMRGTDEHGEPIEIQDPMVDTLRPLAQEGGADPRPMLGVHSIFGDLAQNEGFVADVEKALQRLNASGARATLAHYLDTVREEG